MGKCIYSIRSFDIITEKIEEQQAPCHYSLKAIYSAVLRIAQEKKMIGAPESDRRADVRRSKTLSHLKGRKNADF